MIKDKVLIVDDSYLEVQVIKDMLEENYEVYYSMSGEGIEDIIISQKIDLVLLDIIMPQTDGFIVCKKLKENNLTQNIPVIFLTAKSDFLDELIGLELGAVDYLIKPIHPLLVRARIKNHIIMKRQQDALKRISFIDGLTGIANRRHFDEVLEKEWKLAVRNSSIVTVLLIDIDFFKKYNDFYGHLQGDDCLKLVAQAIKDSATKTADLVARYGGEEFVILLPETDAIGAIKVANSIRQNIQNLDIPHEKSLIDRQVTVSIGIATTRSSAYKSSKQLLDLSDQALYQAKKNGRNTISIKKV